MSIVVGAVPVPTVLEATAAAAQQGGVQGGEINHAKVRKSLLGPNLYARHSNKYFLAFLYGYSGRNHSHFVPGPCAIEVYISNTTL